MRKGKQTGAASRLRGVYPTLYNSGNTCPNTYDGFLASGLVAKKSIPFKPISKVIGGN